MACCAACGAEESAFDGSGGGAGEEAADQIRWRIEQVIANLKTWHTLKTGYRRPTDTLPDTITATLGIIFTYTL